MAPIRAGGGHRHRHRDRLRADRSSAIAQRRGDPCPSLIYQKQSLNHMTLRTKLGEQNVFLILKICVVIPHTPQPNYSLLKHQYNYSTHMFHFRTSHSFSFMLIKLIQNCK